MVHRKKTRIVLSILSILVALMSSPLIMVAPMIFDSPGSSESLLAQFLFYTLLSFPVLSMLGAILPWMFKSHPKSIWLYSLTGLAIVQFLVSIMLLETP
ncbi:hypothetical protein [Thalassospira lucentensis]|uniref:hypothetical protein n=1 Tax=Thalassospira lucentensis TaxID=168935 RepID=UPI003AA83D7D